jgi:hypothetical protein
MIKTLFAGALLAAFASAFVSGTADAAPRKPPTPPNPGCHASMPPQLCDIIWKRDKKGPPQASVQRTRGLLVVRPR